jgi:methionyl-tRNA formyltransferase
VVNYAVQGGAGWVWPTIEAVGLPTMCPSNTLELLAGIAVSWPPPERLFFLNWSYRVPEEITSRFECVNFHASPLPYFRGGHPIENIILSGYRSTVITAHRMTSEIDAGPIYGVSDPIGLDGTKEQITARFVEPVAKLMRWIIEANPEPTPQVGEPTFCKRLSSEAYQEFWAKRAHG